MELLVDLSWMTLSELELVHVLESDLQPVQELVPA